MVKGFVIGIRGYLSQNSGNRLVDTAFEKSRADSVLQVVSDISLAHGRADRHGSGGISLFRMILAQLVHGCVDHAYLRGIAVDNSNLPAGLDKVSNDLGGRADRGLLLRKIRSQGIVPKGYHNSFFCHNKIPLSVESVTIIVTL